MEKNFAVCEEMMSSVTISDKKERDCLVCPKPRRLSQLNYTVNDSKAGLELLDMIFSKGGQDTEYSNHVTSSPPFFCGSPPSRATNPVVQDAHFGDRKVNSSSPLLNMSLSPTSLTGKVVVLGQSLGKNRQQLELKVLIASTRTGGVATSLQWLRQLILYINSDGVLWELSVH